MSKSSKKFSCKSCTYYAAFAYFCTELQRWVFPEDYGECPAYTEGSYMSMHRENK